MNQLSSDPYLCHYNCISGIHINVVITVISDTMYEFTWRQSRIIQNCQNLSESCHHVTYICIHYGPHVVYHCRLSAAEYAEEMKCNYERYRNLVINLYQEGIPASVCIYDCLHVLEIGQYMNVLCTYCSSNIYTTHINISRYQWFNSVNNMFSYVWLYLWKGFSFVHFMHPIFGLQRHVTLVCVVDL